MVAEFDDSSDVERTAQVISMHYWQQVETCFEIRDVYNIFGGSAVFF